MDYPTFFAQAAPPTFAQIFVQFLPFLGVMVLFWFLMIRPQQKQEQRRLAMIAAVKKNDRVLTVGGIYGTVVHAIADSNKLVVRVDDENNVRMTFSRASIVKVLTGDGEEDGGEADKGGRASDAKSATGPRLAK